MNFIDLVINHASGYHAVLDIGCGPGTHLKKVRAPRRVGIDAWRPEIDLARKDPQMGLVFLEACIEDMALLFVPDSFDCVMGIDIIEHFDKDYVLDYLLPTCERIATCGAVFFIPAGVHEQTSDVRGLDNHELQTHRSIWYPADMKQLGYNVAFNPTYYRPQPGKERGAMVCIKER